MLIVRQIVMEATESGSKRTVYFVVADPEDEPAAQARIDRQVEDDRTEDIGQLFADC